MTPNLFDYVDDLSQNTGLEIITCSKKKKDLPKRIFLLMSNTFLSYSENLLPRWIFLDVSRKQFYLLIKLLSTPQHCGPCTFFRGILESTLAFGLISYFITDTGINLEGISYYPGPGLSLILNTKNKINIFILFTYKF